MNCPNCGRELAEGEVCNCTENVVNTVPTEAPVENPAPAEAAPAHEQAPYTPPQENYYTPPVAPVPPQPNYYAAPPVVKARTDYPKDYKIKKKLVACILAVTLGPFGVHNFYLGNNNKAIAQLLVALIGSLFFGLGFLAAWVWATIEAVLIFIEKDDMDANGFKIMTFEESIAKAIKESNNEE